MQLKQVAHKSRLVIEKELHQQGYEVLKIKTHNSANHIHSLFSSAPAPNHILNVFFFLKLQLPVPDNYFNFHWFLVLAYLVLLSSLTVVLQAFLCVTLVFCSSIFCIYKLMLNCSELILEDNVLFTLSFLDLKAPNFRFCNNHLPSRITIL